MKDTNKATTFQKILIFTLVGIVPFIVYAVFYDMPIMGDNGQLVERFDYFNYVKVLIIKIIALLMLLDMIADTLTSEKKSFNTVPFKDRIKNNINSKFVFIALIVISTIIAYIFSDYKPIASFGAMERFEGIWTHFSYAIIFIYCLRFFKRDNAFDIFAYATLFSTFIVGGIGTLQFFNINPFASSLIKTLTYKNFDISIVSDGSFTTMYNTNTSGSYTLLMMFVLSIIFTLYNNKTIRIISIVDFILVFITFFNSYSEASYIALVAGIGVFLLLSLIKLFANGKKKEGFILLIVYIAILIAALIFTFTSQKVANLFESFMGPEATFTDWAIENNNEVYFYNADDEYIKIITNNDGYQVLENDKKIFDCDFSEGSNVSLDTQNFGTIQLSDVVGSDDQNYISFNDYFLIRDSIETQLVTKEDLTPIEHYEAIGFERHPNLFTNRGFIWSRSIPLFLERPIVGYGSDVFFMVFPNKDYVGKSFGNQPMNVMVDKPHNIYLNMSINNGIFYLIGFIGIVFVVVKEKCALLYSANVSKRNSIATMIYISGIIAYLVNGLSTDNLVVITMLFWVILSFNNMIFSKNSTIDKLDNKNEPN